MKKEDGGSVVPWVLGGLAFVLFVVGVVYVWFQVKNVVFPWKRFFVSLAWVFGVLLVLLIIGFVVAYFVRRGDKPVSELPKEYVNVEDAKRVWLECFIKGTGVPYRLVDGVVVSVKKGVVGLRNSQDFVDPTGQTANKFLKFECHSFDGDMRGVNLAVIPLDRGLDFIRGNWSAWLKQHKVDDVYGLRKNLKDFPLTNSGESVERLAYKKTELLSEGYSEREASEFIQPFETAKPRQTIIVERGRRRSRDLREDVPEVFDEGDSFSQVDEAVEAYRGREQ